ncbi:MAG TPA: glycosyltransferase [Stellaceae bacterium]|nr:glycosyltransferase [Stellaceae bacterium]
MSLTPASLDADSRTFRIAASLAEAGFRSIVVEARASAQRFWDDRIEVRSPAVQPSAAIGHRASLARGAVAALRSGALGAPGELALYFGFRLYDWGKHLRGLRALVPAADLYYLHSFELYRLAAEQAARSGAPIVYDAHDFYRGIEPAERLRSFDRNRLRPYLDRLEDRLVARADAVVTVSDGVAALMAGEFGRRPAVIRNCHDARRDRPVAPDLRAVLRIAPRDRLAVVAGNAKAGMAIDTAADAFALLGEGFHLAFVGRGYEATAKRLRSHPAAGRLHFIGGLAPNEIVPLIAAADLGLVLYEPYSENYRAALPNGFFQIVAAGLPVVRGALPEIEAAIAGRAVGVSLPTLDAPSLAKAVEACATRAAALRPAVAALAQELSWETESARLFRLLDQLFARPDSPRAVAAG